MRLWIVRLTLLSVFVLGVVPLRAQIFLDFEYDSLTFPNPSVANVGDSVMYDFTLRNQSGTPFIDSLTFHISTNAGTFELAAFDSVSIASFDTAMFHLQDTVSLLRYGGGVNVIVVWPTSPSPIVTDSLRDTLTVLFVSIDPKIEAHPGLIIYPNPTRDQVYLSRSADLPPIRRTEIIAADGRVVADFPGLPTHASVADLPQGIYLLRIRDDLNRVSTHRFVRQ